MSTRAQITVEGTGVYIYKHSDGYPNGPHGVLTTLEPVCEQFVKERGEEPDYLLAQIIRRFAIKDEQDYQSRVANGDEMAKYFKPEVPIGWGLEAGFEPKVIHGDVEYLYRVDPKTGQISVEDPNNYRS